MDKQDFDGDQLMFYRPTDKETMDLARQYQVHHGFMSSTYVNRVEHGMVLHNEVISMQNQFLMETDEDDEYGIALEEL